MKNQKKRKRVKERERERKREKRKRDAVGNTKGMKREDESEDGGAADDEPLTDYSTRL